MTELGPRTTVDKMVEVAEVTLESVEGVSKADFLADRTAQQELVINMAILGELAGHLLSIAPEVAAGNPTVPWRRLKAMRDEIAQESARVDVEQVWATVQGALPDVLRELRMVDTSV